VNNYKYLRQNSLMSHCNR